MAKKRTLLFLLLLFPFIATSNELPLLFEQQRASYLQVEKLIREEGNEQAFRAKLDQLKSYPLYPYLIHLWLNRYPSYNKEIRQFLSDYPTSRYAALLQNKWFESLAKHQQWDQIIASYHRGKSLAMDCHYNWALYSTGSTEAALKATKQIWIEHLSLPKQCDAIIRQLIESSYLTDADHWQKFASALEHKKPDIANKIQALMNETEQKAAALWLKIHRRPSLVKSFSSWVNSYPQSGLIFAHGVTRLANKDVRSAVELWDMHHKQFDFDRLHSQQIEKLLAIAMVKNKVKGAYHRLNQLIDVDQKTRKWRVRSALLENNWRYVSSAVERLTSQEKSKPEYQYWRARALWEQGKKLQAKRLFNKIAKTRSFYGLIAADYLGRPYQLEAESIIRDDGKIARFMLRDEFKAVGELKYFNRAAEAQKQWYFALENLDPWQLPAAARAAMDNGWNKLAFGTIKQADYWDDVSLFFPISYRRKVFSEAKKRQLDPAIIFALIRRESGFNKDAVSPVGAHGLMQIMPNTGKFIARRLNEPWSSEAILFNPEINLKYGSYYYKLMLRQFDNNFVLAAAAYNAGPHRVTRWLPQDETVPADIWIELIPFTETRKYVKAILTYALIYQQQLNRDTLKMSDFLKAIPPAEKQQAQLPFVAVEQELG